MLESLIRIFTNRVLSKFGMTIVQSHPLEKRGVFSHFDEENILKGLVEELGVTRFYVDIGASDGVSNSNTVRLAINGWEGVCFEYDKKKVAKMVYAYKELAQVSVCCAKITPLNVCSFLESYGVPQKFGVLNLDIDGYDYFVLEALLARFEPCIIVAEVNERIPPPLEFTVLFDPSYFWDTSRFFGQSICKLEKLCKKYQYAIVALEYNNAFLISPQFGRKGLSAHEAYEKGYRLRADRKQKYPLNVNMEDLLSMNPEDAIRFLKTYFAKYDGKYSLSFSSDSG